MLETADEIAALEQVLSHSIESAGPFLRSSLEMPQKSLKAGQILRYWDGLKTTAVAFSTGKGEPRVAPTGVMLVHGQFIVPTVAEAARARAVARRPAISLSHFDESDLAIIVHGTATLVFEVDAGFDELAALQRSFERSGHDVRDWGGTGVYLRVAAEVVHTFARWPERFQG